MLETTPDFQLFSQSLVLELLKYHQIKSFTKSNFVQQPKGVVEVETIFVNPLSFSAKQVKLGISVCRLRAWASSSGF